MTSDSILKSRITIITGHYGSGKTEFALNLALSSPRVCSSLQKTALIDLDIVNPYFRSREYRSLLEDAGVSLYGSVYKMEIGAELPALGADIKTPLEDSNCKVIIDVGGNDTGALVLNQFSKYFADDDTTMLTVVNANRPDTSTIDGILEHITTIESVTGLKISYLINNTHLLRETTTNDILHGYELCLEVSEKTGKKILCSLYPEGIIDPDELTEITKNLMPLGLYTRPTWLDK